MLHVGLDMHKQFSQLAVLNDAGVVVDRCKLYHDNHEAIANYFRNLLDDATVALEASRSWYWLYELLEVQGVQVKLVHPRKARLIAESTIKTDKIDALVLAQLERTGFLPEAYIPPQAVRDQRELLRYRIALVHARSRFKNRIQALLSKLGILHPFADLFGRAGRQFLEQLALRDAYRIELEGSLAMIDALVTKIEAVNQEIKTVVKPDPRAELLMTIPGVGYLTAYLMLCEIGEISRFSSAKKLCAYAGLVPTTKQSAEHCWHGHLTHDGDRYLRWGADEAAQKAPSKDPWLARFYARIARRQGGAKARIAVARKIMESAFQILVKREPYHRMIVKPELKHV